MKLIQKIRDKCLHLQRIQNGVQTGAVDVRKVALAGIAVELGILGKRKVRFVGDTIREDGKLILTDSEELKVFLKELIASTLKPNIFDTKRNATFKIKYLYWTIKQDSGFSQKMPKRVSLARVQKWLELDTLDKLPDPLKKIIWLQNDTDMNGESICDESKEYGSSSPLKFQKLSVFSNPLYNSNQLNGIQTNILNNKGTSSENKSEILESKKISSEVPFIEGISFQSYSTFVSRLRKIDRAEKYKRTMYKEVAQTSNPSRRVSSQPLKKVVESRHKIQLPKISNGWRAKRGSSKEIDFEQRRSIQDKTIQASTIKADSLNQKVVRESTFSWNESKVILIINQESGKECKF